MVRKTAKVWRAAFWIGLVTWTPNLAAQSLSDALATTAGCALLGEARAEMPVNQLFQQQGNQCEAANPRNSLVSDSLTWYSDASCNTRVPFVPTSLADFCIQVDDDQALGSAQNIVANSWTLTPGSRMDVGVLSLDGVPQPYMQRIKYASFQTNSGLCELEMRVYSPKPNSTGHRTLIALHGGSWRFRGLGYVGLESVIPHFVDAGFVVYAPFYRLIDDVDGSTGCQNASMWDLGGDAQTALNWVRANADNYGSSGKPVLFGQSAGAHLAGSLWLNRRNDVSGAVLLYPPTDFTDFATRVQTGEYTNPQGLNILNLVVGKEANDIDLSDSLIRTNSYPLRVAEQPDNLAPVMLLHGLQDTLVEPRQSIRLCNALAGRDLDEDMTSLTVGGNQTISCDPPVARAFMPSALHLFEEGRHAMDVCIEGGLFAAQTCPAGSTASAEIIATTLSQAADFSQNAFDAMNGDASDNIDPNAAESSDSKLGFGAFFHLLALLFGAVFLRRAIEI